MVEKSMTEKPSSEDQGKKGKIGVGKIMKRDQRDLPFSQKRVTIGYQHHIFLGEISLLVALLDGKFLNQGHNSFKGQLPFPVAVDFFQKPFDFSNVTHSQSPISDS
jgi:hypothetical protein